MNKRILILLSFLLLLALLLSSARFRRWVVYNFVAESVVEENEQLLAIYSPGSGDDATPEPAPLYLRLYLKNTALAFPAGLLRTTLATGRPVVITVETWPRYNLLSRGSDNVLEQILAGDFDRQIHKLGQLVTSARQPVWLRLNPFMELPEQRFPWQFQKPQAWIDSYNHIAEHLHTLAPAARVVWSPCGYPGDSEYWPGAEHTEAIAITLDHTACCRDSIAINLRQKMHRLRFMDKPVLIFGHPESSACFSHQLLTEIDNLRARYAATIYSPDHHRVQQGERPRRRELQLGLYDPQLELTGTAEVTAEHLFTDWGEIQNGAFADKFAAVQRRRHDVIVTMEPWRDTTGVDDPQVLAHVVAGRYDREIAALYRILARARERVYLRWAHEMEIPITRYPWQSQDPVTWILAYRYFMLFDARQPGHLFRVWGPAGDRGSIDFWPGSDVVDYISIAIYGLPDKDIEDHTRQESFAKIFQRKSWRMRFFPKPFFITEFGIKGPEEYQSAWLQEAAAVLNAEHSVFGVSYFNLHDNPEVWGNIPAPNWSISQETWKNFTAALQGIKRMP